MSKSNIFTSETMVEERGIQVINPLIKRMVNRKKSRKY